MRNRPTIVVTSVAAPNAALRALAEGARRRGWNFIVIGDALAALDVRPGVEHLADNLRACYEKLVSMSLVGAAELQPLEAWLADLREISEAP